jgi:hypothetical protein
MTTQSPNTRTLALAPTVPFRFDATHVDLPAVAVAAAASGAQAAAPAPPSVHAAPALPYERVDAFALHEDHGGAQAAASTGGASSTRSGRIAVGLLGVTFATFAFRTGVGLFGLAALAGGVADPGRGRLFPLVRAVEEGATLVGIGLAVLASIAVLVWLARVTKRAARLDASVAWGLAAACRPLIPIIGVYYFYRSTGEVFRNAHRDLLSPLRNMFGLGMLLEYGGTFLAVVLPVVLAASGALDARDTNVAQTLAFHTLLLATLAYRAVVVFLTDRAAALLPD